MGGGIFDPKKCKKKVKKVGFRLFLGSSNDLKALRVLMDFKEKMRTAALDRAAVRIALQDRLLFQIEPVEIGAAVYVCHTHRVFAGRDIYARHPKRLVGVAFREFDFADASAVD